MKKIFLLIICLNIFDLHSGGGPSHISGYDSWDDENVLSHSSKKEKSKSLTEQLDEETYKIIKETCLARLAIKPHCKSVQINLDALIEIRSNAWPPTFFLLQISSFDETLFEELIKNGANVNLVTTDYKAADWKNIFGPMSLLECAIEKGQARAVEILIKYGANVNSRFPLGRAIDFRRLEICQLLLDAGVNANFGFKDNYLCSPLIMALRKAEVCYIAWKINEYNSARSPEKCLEDYKVFVEIIKILLEHGANENKKVDWNNNFSTACSPYQYAQRNGLSEIVKIFDEHQKIKQQNKKIINNEKKRIKQKFINAQFLLEDSLDSNTREEPGDYDIDNAPENNSNDVISSELEDRVYEMASDFDIYNNKPTCRAEHKYNFWKKTKKLRKK